MYQNKQYKLSYNKHKGLKKKSLPLCLFRKVIVAHIWVLSTDGILVDSYREKEV